MTLVLKKHTNSLNNFIVTKQLNIYKTFKFNTIDSNIKKIKLYELIYKTINKYLLITPSDKKMKFVFKNY